MLKEFRIKARAFLDYEPKNNLEWLAIAQHYGLKTRLLDWTENALAALWFCVREENNNNKNTEFGVVWSLRPIKLSSYYVDDENDFKNPFKIDSTKIYKPSYISKRIIAQSGVFTLHNWEEVDNKPNPINRNKDYKTFLKSIYIPKNCFGKIKKELKEYGIHKVTLFPGLDGLCETMNEFYTSSLDNL